MDTDPGGSFSKSESICVHLWLRGLVLGQTCSSRNAQDSHAARLRPGSDWVSVTSVAKSAFRFSPAGRLRREFQISDFRFQIISVSAHQLFSLPVLWPSGPLAFWLSALRPDKEDTEARSLNKPLHRVTDWASVTSVAKSVFRFDVQSWLFAYESCHGCNMYHAVNDTTPAKMNPSTHVVAAVANNAA